MHLSTIQTLENGPYKVEGQIRLIDSDGGEYAVDLDDTAYLCRCGMSRNKPFCDGTHASNAFEATDRAPEEPPAG